MKHRSIAACTSAYEMLFRRCINHAGGNSGRLCQLMNSVLARSQGSCCGMCLVQPLGSMHLHHDEQCLSKIVKSCKAIIWIGCADALLSLVGRAAVALIAKLGVHKATCAVGECATVAGRNTGGEVIGVRPCVECKTCLAYDTIYHHGTLRRRKLASKHTAHRLLLQIQQH